MKPTRRAERLARSASANWRRLDRLVQVAAAGSWDRVSEDLVSYVVIEAQNTWANFVRAYYLSCWRETRLASGAKVQTAPVFAATTEQQVLGWAVNRYRKPKNKKKPGPSGQFNPRDEPAWFALKTLLDLADDLKCSNLASIQSAVSARPAVFAAVPVFRNYFAHRNRYTEADAQALVGSLGLPAGLSPAAALIYRPVTKPVSTLGQWLVDLENAALDLCR